MEETRRALEEIDQLETAAVAQLLTRPKLVIIDQQIPHITTYSLMLISISID